MTNARDDWRTWPIQKQKMYTIFAQSVTTAVHVTRFKNAGKLIGNAAKKTGAKKAVHTSP
jgi:hypothetical protein